MAQDKSVVSVVNVLPHGLPTKGVHIQSRAAINLLRRYRGVHYLFIHQTRPHTSERQQTMDRQSCLHHTVGDQTGKISQRAFFEPKLPSKGSAIGHCYVSM